MERIFDNGATRARARAWGWWLLTTAGLAGACAAGRPAGPWRWLCLLLALGLASRWILVRRQPLKIPVLNYHSVSDRPEWLGIPERVSLEVDAFERQLVYLKSRGYRSLFISEAQALLAKRGRPAPGERCVALTFDDGYADNWIAAHPLLQKHGFKATLFVGTGFIGEGETCRPTLEGLSGRERANLDWSGYLTWSELRAMEAGGVFEIQPHGRAHTRVFTGPDLRGFAGPGKLNPWLLWEAFPETRATWWRGRRVERPLWGRPLFRQGPALASRAWRPDPDAVAGIQAWGAAQGESFYDHPKWEQRLVEEWRRREKNGQAGGTWESDTDFERRVEADLRGAREDLHARLGVRADILCWPENAFSPAAEAAARRIGYTATVSNRHNSRNIPGEAPARIVRVFIGGRAAGVRSKVLDYLAFVLEVRVFEGGYLWYPPLAALHLCRKAVFAARRLAGCRNYVSIWD